MFTLKSFYKSSEWENFRKIVISERTQLNGLIFDEITGNPILKPYDLILHHKTELTEENVNDYRISLNPENIQVVSFKTHNELHKRFGYKQCKKVFLVYGAPCSGKTTFVYNNADTKDLILDLDRLWGAVRSNKCSEYEKPNELKSVIFSMRDNLLDIIKTRYGKWRNAYVIGGYPLIGERERLIDMLGVDRDIFIDTQKAVCLERAKIKGGEWSEYVETWFDRFTPDLPPTG